MSYRKHKLMNMKFLPLAVVALLLHGPCLKAQTKDSVVLNVRSITQIIRGTVIDKVTKMPMPGVTVRLPSSPAVKATNTDQNGVFRLSGVPLGRQ